MKKLIAKIPLVKRYLDLLQRVANIESLLDIIYLNINFTSVSDKCAFNGQVERRGLVEALVKKISFDCFFETGTFLGLSTSYMARAFPNLKIITCELNSINLRIASNNLQSYENVKLLHGDSVNVIKEYSTQDTIKKSTLFYLDAHWGVDNPLREELEIITKKFISFVVIIDDFCVIDDAEYGWDAGFTKVDDNRLENIQTLISARSVGVYFPAVPSFASTGARRGSIIICSSNLIAHLDTMQDHLRRYQV